MTILATARLRAAATALAVAGLSLAWLGEVAAQGSSSSGGTSSTGVGRGTQSPGGPGSPATPQPGTASPGTSPTGTTSMGDRAPSGRTDMPTNRTPAPNIVDRSNDPGRGDTSGGTIGATAPPARSPAGGRGTTNLATLPPAQIQTLQSALNRAGVAVAVDGQVGPQTRRALEQYQRDNGLAATGELDDQTRSRLGIEGGR